MSEPLILGVILASFLGVIIGIQLLMFPLRLRLVRLAEEVISDPNTPDNVREDMNERIDRVMSFRVGLVLPLAAIAVIADVALGLIEFRDEPSTDERVHKVRGLQLLSVLAVNPLAALVSIPLLAVAFVAFALRMGSLRNAAEEAAEDPLAKAVRSVKLSRDHRMAM